MSKGNGYVSSGQMAKVLGCSMDTVSRYCRDGLLPGSFQTMGGHWRIPRKFFEQAEAEKDLKERPVPD